MGAATRNSEMLLTLDFTAVGPDSGGVGTVARGIAQGLQDLSIDFTCLVSALQAADWAERAPTLASSIHPVRVALAPTSGWQVRLRRILPRGRVTQYAVGAIRRLRARSIRDSTSEGVVWSPFHRVPVTGDHGVVTVHDLRVFEADLASPMDRRIITENVDKARAVICSWPHPYRGLLERFPQAKNKTFLIPLPVLNPGTPSDRRAPDDRPIRLLFPGYVTPHKNHEVLIRALPLLPDAVAVLTGAEDGAYGQRMRALSHDLGVADRIEWRGFVSSDELEDEYRRADLLVMPTRWEAASGPLYEAIARELPFVASDIPPIRAQLQSIGLSAETFAWDSPTALASAVRDTISGYTDHIAGIRAVAGPIRERSWAQTASDYHRVFEWVAGRSPRPDDLTIG